MRTKRKLLPKSDVDGSAQECTSTEGVRNGCQNLQRSGMGHLGVSPNTNITTPTSLPFADDVDNISRKQNGCQNVERVRIEYLGVSLNTSISTPTSLPFANDVESAGALKKLVNVNIAVNTVRHYFGLDRVLISCEREYSNLHRDIVEGLIELLDTHNALVKLFRNAREKSVDVPNFQVRLYNVVGAYEYELPTGDMLGAIVYEPGPETKMDYGIVIEEQPGYPQRANKLHSSYMSLQFPLLFLYGEDSYSKDFKLVGDTEHFKTYRRLTMKAYYAYLIHDRKSSYNYFSISELPSKDTDPECYRIVSKLMMHAPCGLAYPSASCTQNGVDCNKHILKVYCSRTYTDNDGFEHYQRRDAADTVLKQHVELDNRVRTSGRRPRMGKYNEKATCTTTPAELRTLFIHILTFCQVTDLVSLWGRIWRTMSEDLLYASLVSLNIPNLHIHDSQIEDYILYELEGCLNHCSRSLTDFDLRLPPEDLLAVLRNRLLMEQKSYNRELLEKEKDTLLRNLNEKQRQMFDLIFNACTNNRQELIFVYGHDDTGKTFLWKTITYTLRADEKIVLTVASSGVASLLLPAGRTIHSRFKLLLDLTDTSVCSIKKTQLANLIKETSLIIWDEAPMNDQRCFETLERTLRDIFSKPGKGSTFAKWLLDIKDGSIGILDECDHENTSWVNIPDIYRIPNDENGITNLIKFIYDDNTLQYPTPQKLQENVIVCLKNEIVDIINAKVMSTILGRAHIYTSYDEALPHDMMKER
nr:DNA helicase [Tanacetum cinerariifolium]